MLVLFLIGANAKGSFTLAFQKLNMRIGCDLLLFFATRFVGQEVILLVQLLRCDRQRMVLILWPWLSEEVRSIIFRSLSILHVGIQKEVTRSSPIVTDSGFSNSINRVRITAKCNRPFKHMFQLRWTRRIGVVRIHTNGNEYQLSQIHWNTGTKHTIKGQSLGWNELWCLVFCVENFTILRTNGSLAAKLQANMHEWAMGITRVNQNYGIVQKIHNRTAGKPHDLETYTGVSSSGSSAIVVSGICSAAL
ncbi:fatty acid amide hydrolase [Artemisia annua]|uniref:Fatty acid amide hydrolase n=1 Tax=Artemisia annua TaxID=35608 RepID=A0A2U1P649_ARTAN|nr:fatty acid amide hydrolase [Artemisia annua]